MSNALKENLTLSQERVEVALDKRLPANTVLPKMLHDAMRYSTLDGGKRMRPMLTYSVGKALGIAPETLDGAACAVEMIHFCHKFVTNLPFNCFSKLDVLLKIALDIGPK
jgi:farnesyl diphosphate synthase